MLVLYPALYIFFNECPVLILTTQDKEKWIQIFCLNLIHLEELHLFLTAWLLSRVQ